MLPCAMMRALCVVSVMLWALSMAASAVAQVADVPRLLVNLRHEDFRVRTQAALALGASKDVRASMPLCRTLADSSATVRAAAAAALGRLAIGGLVCLEQRYEIESNETVRETIEQAVELVFQGYRISDTTKYYVAIARLSDKSGGAGNDPAKWVRAGMLASGGALSGFAFAPAWEDETRAKQRLASRPKVKAFYLSPRLPPFEYTGGNLTVKLEVAMFSYPDKALIGNFNVRLTQPDVEQNDAESERDLLKMAAERAMQRFATLAKTL